EKSGLDIRLDWRYLDLREFEGLALSLGYLSPETFNVTQSIELFAIVAVGGQGSIVGPILGAVFFFEATNTFSASGSASELFFALILLVVVILFNRGLYDLIERAYRALRGLAPRAKAAKKPTEPEPTVLHGADDELTTRVARRTAPGADTEVLLKVSDLGVDFGGVKALDGVSLDVRRGEVHAIIGPNGAGKTTFLNCISGIQVASGTIDLNGGSLAGISVSDRRQLGLARTFQHPSLIADLSVLRNVAIGAYSTQRHSLFFEMINSPGSRRRRAEADERAIAALRTVDFPQDRWTVPAGDATMGEQKHVDIARAISSQPTLLLLDEPTAGLGTEEVSAVADAIAAARDAGVTILVIAHHVGFIRQVADRCTVLDFGKVLVSGTPEEVLEDHRVIDIFVGTGAKS
ncbi:MAG: ATP-binding cassette domain-containing protein, partial [Actinomycetota bacterium]